MNPSDELNIEQDENFGQARSPQPIKEVTAFEKHDTNEWKMNIVRDNNLMRQEDLSNHTNEEEADVTPKKTYQEFSVTGSRKSLTDDLQLRLQVSNTKSINSDLEDIEDENENL